MTISVSVKNVKNLGVIMDSALILDILFLVLWRLPFINLESFLNWNFFFLLTIWRLLFMPLCHHASITVILYIGISQGQLSHLQLVQNAGARLLTHTKKRDNYSSFGFFTLVACRILNWI